MMRSMRAPGLWPGVNVGPREITASCGSAGLPGRWPTTSPSKIVREPRRGEDGAATRLASRSRAVGRRPQRPRMRRGGFSPHRPSPVRRSALPADRDGLAPSVWGASRAAVGTPPWARTHRPSGQRNRRRSVVEFACFLAVAATRGWAGGPFAPLRAEPYSAPRTLPPSNTSVTAHARCRAAPA